MSDNRPDISNLPLYSRKCDMCLKDTYFIYARDHEPFDELCFMCLYIRIGKQEGLDGWHLVSPFT